MSRADLRLKTDIAVSSDQFFLQSDKKFDVIFIDGLHTEEQVLRDITNALRALNGGGTIVLHDCNPITEHMQRDIPRDDHNGPWTGLAWRVFVHLRMNRNDLAMAVVDCDYGVGLIRRGKQKLYKTGKNITYALLESDRKKMLNLIPPQKLNDWLLKNEGK